jgi:hypothetical protein
MKRITQLPAVDRSIAIRSCSRAPVSPFRQRCLHTTPPKPATAGPITVSAPPPNPPIPSATHVDSRVARRRKQAELLKRGQDMRSIAAGSGGGTAKLKRFWNNVYVKHADGKLPSSFFPFLETICQPSNLQRASKSISTSALSAAPQKPSSTSRTTNHISPPLWPLNGTS